VDTGRSLSSGWKQAGPVGRYDEIDEPSHLLDQLHLRAIRGLDESDVAAVIDLLQHDVRAVAAEFGDRAAD
jgi:hypothetical protein